MMETKLNLSEAQGLALKKLRALVGNEQVLQGESGAKGAERPKGETKRPEGAERKKLAHKLEDSKVIDYRGLLLTTWFICGVHINHVKRLVILRV